MAYLALYRKYRPKSFSEMVGQDKIITVIRNAVINDKVSHAYLFSGPRGTGKTTTAKIIAKMVNCENLVDGVPCGKCHSCVNILDSSDVIEIDAASNNGVDEIRDLRDKVNLVPSECKYKIYIIDEVHMLTTQAFNALLKTLEEPPKHVIFILATTEIHKIPMTIISRCQKFQFTKISDVDMVSNLRRIATMEKIEVSDEVLYEISRLSDGCCRDAVNLFDQLISYADGNLTIDQLYDISGSVSYIDLYNILILINEKNALELMNFCDKINRDGKSIFKFVEELILFIKDLISYKVGIDNIMISDKREKIEDLSKLYDDTFLYNMIELLNDLLNKLKLSSYPSILLSVTLLKFINDSSNNFVNINNVKIKEENFSEKPVEKTRIAIENNGLSDISNEGSLSVSEAVGLSLDSIDIRINNTFATASKDILNIVRDKWKNIDNFSLDENFASIAGVLKDCMPVVAGKEYLMVTGKYDSLIDRFNSMYLDIEKLLKNLLGNCVNVVAITEEKWKNEKNKYIENLKNGIKYEIKDLPILGVDNIDNSVEKTNQNDIDVLKDLVGDDIIEYI